jgi:hypothetical protein
VRRFIVAAALLSALTAARGAPAQGTDKDQAAARALFDEGVGLMKEGHYDDACPRLEASLKKYPGIGTRGKLAECYEKIGRFVSAWSLWREVAQLAMRAGEPTREQVASERAKALEPKLSYITVAVAPANDVPGLVIKRNGQQLERSKLGAADPVDAGAVAFEIAAPGKKPFTAQVTLAPGQSVKFDVPALESASPGAAAAQPGGAGEPPPPGREAAQGTPSSSAQTDAPGWQRPLGLGLAGLGVVGLGVGAVFGLKAKSTYDGAFNGGGCDKTTKQCDVGGQNAVIDARNQATLSTVVVAAGAACLVGGAVLFFTAKPKKVGVVPTPGGVLLMGTL